MSDLVERDGALESGDLGAAVGAGGALSSGTAAAASGREESDFEKDASAS